MLTDCCNSKVSIYAPCITCVSSKHIFIRWGNTGISLAKDEEEYWLHLATLHAELCDTAWLPLQDYIENIWPLLYSFCYVVWYNNVSAWRRLIKVETLSSIVVFRCMYCTWNKQISPIAHLIDVQNRLGLFIVTACPDSWLFLSLLSCFKEITPAVSYFDLGHCSYICKVTLQEQNIVQ